MILIGVCGKQNVTVVRIIKRNESGEVLSLIFLLLRYISEIYDEIYHWRMIKGGLDLEAVYYGI